MHNERDRWDFEDVVLEHEDLSGFQRLPVERSVFGLCISLFYAKLLTLKHITSPPPNGMVRRICLPSRLYFFKMTAGAELRWNGIGCWLVVHKQLKALMTNG
jgi:hypothetical protein